MTINSIKKAHVLLPDANAVIQCVKLATSLEVASYIETRLKEKLTEASVFSKAKEFYDMVVSELTQKFPESSDASPWTGERVKTRKIISPRNPKSSEGLDIRHSTPDDITFEVAIGDSGEILRTYTHNNQVLDENTIEKLDDTFKSWLLKHNYVIQKGRIGSVDPNDSSKVTFATPNQVFSLINDKDQGLTKFFGDQGKNLNIQERDFAQALSQTQEVQAIP